jgi:hypothetical protein
VKLTIRTFGVFLSAVFILAFEGCYGNPPPQQQGVSVTLSSGSTLALDAGQSATITATTTDDNGAGVSWTCSGTACTAGTNLSSQSTTSVKFTASTTGSATITATSVKDSGRQATVNVTVTAVPSLTGATLGAASVGTAYNATVTETGGAGTLTYSVSTGSLPAGLTLNTSTGAISGTPTGPASTTPVTFSLTVQDSGSPKLTSTAQFSILVNNYSAPTLAPPSGALPGATVGTMYTQTFTVTGGHSPYTFTVINGTLPAGLTTATSAATFTISGTPTLTSCASCAFSVKVTDSSNPAQSVTNNYTLSVSGATGTLAFSTTSPLPQATVGTAYSTTVTATGGTAPYTFSVDAGGTQLPAGLSLTTGSPAATISGTPTVTGTFTNVLIDVTDSTTPTANHAQMAFSLTIIANPVIVAPASGPLPNATLNAAYSETITATGGVTPYTFTLDASSAALPAGLSFSATGTSAMISGTATTLGTTTGIIVDVKDSSTGSTTQQITYSITVTQACGSGSESLISGQYAMLLKGYDNGMGTGESGPNPVAFGAVLYIDGTGNIVAGTVDFNSYASAGSTSSGVVGTYTIGADQRGCMSLTTDSGTYDFRFSLAGISSGVAASAHVTDFDAAGPFVSGVMLQQDPSAFESFGGNYAFEVSSPQNRNAEPDGGEGAAAGVLNFTSGTVTGTMDINWDGTLNRSTSTTWTAATPATVEAGGVYTVDANNSNGRGALSFAIDANNTEIDVDDIMYVINANEALIFGGADQTSDFLVASGVALKQAGTISASSLNGTSILRSSFLQSNGVNPATASTELATVTTTSGGSFTLSGWENTGSAIQSTSVTGTLAVDPSGRVTFSSGGGTGAPVLWLVSANEAFILGAAQNVQTGIMEAQTATTVTTGTPYAFGTVDPLAIGADQIVGVATSNGTSFSGTTDDNAAGTLNPNVTLGPLTYTVDGTGLGTIPAGCTLGGGGNTCQQIFYIVSPTSSDLMYLTQGATIVNPPTVDTANQ